MYTTIYIAYKIFMIFDRTYIYYSDSNLARLIAQQRHHHDRRPVIYGVKILLTHKQKFPFSKIEIILKRKQCQRQKTESKKFYLNLDRVRVLE